jgi:hypothetical protein
VAALLADEAGVVVRSPEEFESFVVRCLEEPDFAAAIGNRAQALVQSQLGATRRTVQLLHALDDIHAALRSPSRSAA